MIPVTLLLIISPLAATVVVYIFRRLTWAASLASAAVAAAFAFLVKAAPQSAEETILGGWVTGGVQTILGRTLELSTGDQNVLFILGMASVILFLLAARQQPGGIFFPGLLALLGVSAAVLMTETFAFRVILMEVLAGTIAILLQGSRFGSTRAAWRFFLFATLAMPLLLVAGWQIDFQAFNPAQFGLLSPAVLLLTIGFIIYLSAVPFHLWMAPASSDSEPLAQILALSFMPMIAFSVYANALQQFDWYANSQIPFQWFTFCGGLSVGLGALLAFHVTGFGRYNSSVVLMDVGAVLLAMGLASREGLQAAWYILIFRFIGLIVWATGLSVIRKKVGSDQVDLSAGLGRRSRLAIALLLYGGLSLAGFPLTPGFLGRWIVLSLIARENINLAFLLLLGTVSGVIGILRIAQIMFKTAPESGEAPLDRQKKWVDQIILGAVLAPVVLLSLFPAPLLAMAYRLAGLDFVIP